jgi:chemotaxis protein MotB
MARKAKHPEHVSHERWLVSYADFITLLFAFFVVMFAVSQVDSQKLGRFVEAVQKALNEPGLFAPSSSRPFALSEMGAGDAPSGQPIAQAVTMRKAGFVGAEGGLQASGALTPALLALAEDPELKGKVSVRMEARGAVVSLLEVGFFDSGQAAIRLDALPLLQRVAGVLRAGVAPLRFEGHADDQPIHNGTYHSNWELSATRALSVLHFFESSLGFQGRRLSAGVFGEHAPTVSNATPEGRQRNRRVDIVVLSEEAARLEPGLEPAPAAAMQAPGPAVALPAAPFDIARPAALPAAHGGVTTEAGVVPEGHHVETTGHVPGGKS